jgi:hypothetical protein
MGGDLSLVASGGGGNMIVANSLGRPGQLVADMGMVKGNLISDH